MGNADLVQGNSVLLWGLSNPGMGCPVRAVSLTLEIPKTRLDIAWGNLLPLDLLWTWGWTRRPLEVLCNLCRSVIQWLWAYYGLWDANLSAHEEKCPQLLWMWSLSSTFHIEQPICHLTLSALDFSVFTGFWLKVVFMGPFATNLLWAIKTAVVYWKCIFMKNLHCAWPQNHLVAGNNPFSPMHGKRTLTGLTASRNLHISLTFSRSLEVKARTRFSLAMGSSDDLSWTDCKDL